MRTDSTSLSETAIHAARDQARQLYGAEAVPAEPRQYNRKVKNAQEAHEAIRPAGDRFRTPDEVSARARAATRPTSTSWSGSARVASQMADARGETVSIRIARRHGERAPDRVRDRRNGDHVPRLPARLRGGPRRGGRVGRERAPLPPLSEGQELSLLAHRARLAHDHASARYTEATLVRTLEERGIGRPSTYAIDPGDDPRARLRAQGRPGARSHLRRLRRDQPPRTALLAARRLRVHRPDGERPRPHRRRATRSEAPGSGASTTGTATASKGSTSSSRISASIDARSINTIQIGNGIELRVGRWGPYIERDGERVTIGDDIAPDELTVERAEELLAQSSDERDLGVNPASGRTVSVKSGRYGPYVTEHARRRRKAADGIAVQDDVARDGDARGRASAALAAARARRRPRRRRGGRRLKRALRAVHPERRRDPVARRARNSC